MAWIKIGHETPDKPEVYAMAKDLGIDPDAVVGKLIRLWRWADEQTYDGCAVGATKELLDRCTFCAGFTAALVGCGWASETEEGISLPNFARHNGETAKTRAQAQKRMERHRSKRARSDVVTPEANDARNQIREEKIREDKKKDTQQASFDRELPDDRASWSHDRFRDAVPRVHMAAAIEILKAYPPHRRGIRQEALDAICRAIGRGLMKPGEDGLVASMASIVKEFGDTVGDSTWCPSAKRWFDGDGYLQEPSEWHQWVEDETRDEDRIRQAVQRVDKEG